MNDFDNIFEQMKVHNMQLPTGYIKVGIASPRTVLENCLSYFLAFDNVEMCWLPEYDEVANWLADNEGRGLFLFGDCGRGKSILTRFVLPAIILKYMRKVVSVYDVQAMNRYLDEVLKKHIISLDDIGTEDLSVSYGNRRQAFAEVMDAAEKYRKLVIISTNLTGDQIIARYGQRVMERIISTTRRIEFKGKSLRV